MFSRLSFRRPTIVPSANAKRIETWTAKSIKDTETFHVPTDEWGISWDTEPGQDEPLNFQIYVYKADGTPHGTFVIGNVIGSDQDSSVIRGSGDYCLSIKTGQPYTVIVEALS